MKSFEMVQLINAAKGNAIVIIDIAPDRCLAGQRGARPATKRTPLRSHIRRRSWDRAKIASIERGWINGKTFFQTPVSGEGQLMQPFGTAAVHDPSRYTNPHAELSALIETQNRELATLPDLMKANGLVAFSLSSSPTGENDDDLEAGNFSDPTEHAASRYGTAYTTIDLMPVQRRIEWERYILGCNQSNRISVEFNETTGKRTIRSSNPRWKDQHRAAYKPHLIEQLGELKPMAEYEAARERAKNGPPVWNHMTEREQLQWDTRRGPTRWYLDFADSNQERETWDDPLLPPDNKDGGEYELSSGQLWVEGKSDKNPFEPREFDLWPLSERERERGVLPIEAAIRRANAAFRNAEAAR